MKLTKIIYNEEFDLGPQPDMSLYKPNENQFTPISQGESKELDLWYDEAVHKAAYVALALFGGLAISHLFVF